MIDNISKKISARLTERKIIAYEEIEIYKYGIELVISSLIGFILIFLCGLIFNCLFESIIFYILFVSVRPFTGGYHANSHLACKSLFMGVYGLVMFITNVFLAHYTFTEHMVMISFYLLSVFLYAPIEHENKPINEQERRKNRMISIIMGICISIVSIVLFKYYIKIAILIAMTLLSIAMLIFFAHLAQKDNDE